MPWLRVASCSSSRLIAAEALVPCGTWAGTWPPPSAGRRPTLPAARGTVQGWRPVSGTAYNRRAGPRAAATARRGRPAPPPAAPAGTRPAGRPYAHGPLDGAARADRRGGRRAPAPGGRRGEAAPLPGPLGRRGRRAPARRT